MQLDGPTAKAPLFPSTRMMDSGCLQRLCTLLALIPHGPLKFSHAVPGGWQSWSTHACSPNTCFLQGWQKRWFLFLLSHYNVMITS